MQGARPDDRSALIANTEGLVTVCNSFLDGASADSNCCRHPATQAHCSCVCVCAVGQPSPGTVHTWALQVWRTLSLFAIPSFTGHCAAGRAPHIPHSHCRAGLLLRQQPGKAHLVTVQTQRTDFRASPA